MASTPVAGWHHKETGDHDGENPEAKGGTFAWGFEATLAAMTGPAFAKRGGSPGMILGMGFHRPGVNPTARLWESLQNVTEREELPCRLVQWSSTAVSTRRESGLSLG